MNSIWVSAEELSRRFCPFVVITLISTHGSAPQDIGAKAIVTESGLHWGTVGGGKVEARAIAEARALLQIGASAPVTRAWNLQTDLGMSCGGTSTLLFEPHHTRTWSVVVFGAGHVGQALTRVLLSLDCRLTCLDPREEWLQRLPDESRLTRVLMNDVDGEVAKLPTDSFFVVMTQGHSTDVPVIDSIFRNQPNAPYVGMMGSKVKAAKVRQELLNSGHSPGLVQSLKSPIGLAIGRNQPEEIAISVAAELMNVRDLWINDRLSLAGSHRKNHTQPGENDSQPSFS